MGRIVKLSVSEHSGLKRQRVKLTLYPLTSATNTGDVLQLYVKYVKMLKESIEKNGKMRVIVYIDGLNLYEGLCERGWKKFLWLDIEKFSGSLIGKNQFLVGVKYFTSRVSYPYDKQLRQTAFIDAISTLGIVEQRFGNFKQDSKRCDRCMSKINYKTEKQTDVNIATEMLVDAFMDKYETAILVSGDSDLVPAIKHIRNLFPDKNVVCAFPPQRESYELEVVSNSAYRIVKKKFRDNQFDSTMVSKNGLEIKKPDTWR